MGKMVNLNFFKDKRVFITGHTGFKGTWLSRILINAGANITGYALEPHTEPNLWAVLDNEKTIHSIIGDIRDFGMLKSAFNEAKPEILFHLAAQPLVRESYDNPVNTYTTNIIGTVNILECARLTDYVQSIVNVTTDKVYRNNEWLWGYRENDPLDGFDPYSNSKSCSELVTASYVRAYFKNTTAVSTVRSGNVIGGGDYAQNRIIPDCVRAAKQNETINIRNPYSIRPYQHVLEALGAYLLLAQQQYKNKSLAGCYNVGPDDNSCINTGNLADIFCKIWGENARWENRFDQDSLHEANFLKLDCSKIKTKLGWYPKWDINNAVQQTIIWEKSFINGMDIKHITDGQIKTYFGV